VTARLLAMLVLASSCSAADAGNDPPAKPDPEPETKCDIKTPIVTWDTFGSGFVNTFCQGCHASTSPDRHGAPADVIFDTEQDTLKRWARVLERSASAEPTMPPAGGPGEDDRERLALWLSCFAAGK
jgi:uncharacterized membrane protein